MNVPPNDSVFWICARQVIIGAAMLAFVSLAYKNKMAPQDIVMILTTMASVLGLDVFKHTKAPDRGDTNDQSKS